MPMQTPHDLFLHELSDIHSAEQMIAKMLQQVAGEVQDEQVKAGLQQHHQETQQQIQNLQQVFQSLGAKPEQVTCHVAKGLQQEHDDFVKEQPSPDVATMFALGAAAKTEHYEIAAYTCLVNKAQAMGHQEALQLLQQNLQQEQQMLQRVEQLDVQLGQQMIEQAGQTGMGQQS